MSSVHSLRLSPWLIRAAIPARLIGTYVLYRQRSPVYIGRSDTDLRRRLLEHSAHPRGDYFTYDIHPSPSQAFEVECSLFHALRSELSNVLHPHRPHHRAEVCPFCADTLADILNARLRA